MNNLTASVNKTLAGQVASAVGLLAFVLGLIILLWQGSADTVVAVLLLLGIAGILLWVVLTPEDALGLITGRQVRYGTLSVIGTVLLVGIVVMAYIASQRAAVIYDLTESNKFTLSRTSLDVINRLPEPVQITGFYSSAMLEQREIDDQIFRQYEMATNGFIRRQYVNPNEEPTIAQAFRVSHDGQVYISFVNADGTPDLTLYIEVPIGFGTERDITGAIARLMVYGTYNIAFEVSFCAIDPNDTGQNGLSGVIAGLSANGLTPLSLNLKDLAATGGDINPEIAAVIITRLVEPLTPGAVEVLARYVDGGGRLFVTADVDFSAAPVMAEDSVFNQYLWETFGLRMLDAVVVDELVSGDTVFDIMSVALSDGSSITDRLNDPDVPDSVTQFRVARPVQVDETPPVTNGFVIQTSPASFAETDLQQASRGDYSMDRNDDYIGPVSVAAWAHNTETGAKLLLIGDNDFLTNGQVAAPAGNGILFTDGIGWLTGYSDEVSFEVQPRITDVPLIFVAPQQLDQIAIFTVILMPGVVLLLGLGVWARRSRR